MHPELGERSSRRSTSSPTSARSSAPATSAGTARAIRTKQGRRGDPARGADHLRLRRLPRDDDRPPVPRARWPRRRRCGGCGRRPGRSSTRGRRGLPARPRSRRPPPPVSSSARALGASKTTSLRPFVVPAASSRRRDVLSKLPGPGPVDPDGVFEALGLFEGGGGGGGRRRGPRPRRRPRRRGRTRTVLAGLERLVRAANGPPGAAAELERPADQVELGRRAGEAS